MSALYEVTISHARSAPLRNVFRYRSYLWLADLDHLPRAWPLARFRARDHLGDPRASIRANLDRFLAARGVDLGGGRVTMLAHARVLGYVFNPLTVYWCHRPDGTLACVVAEVHNTYRQRHAYLLRTDDRGRADVPKQFYVSPFYPVDGRYRMSLPEPGERLSLSVRLDRPDGHSFAASVRGRAREQQALAARRVAAAGLADRVRVELRDYRDLDGRFDAICSVEMLEAVGERYWDTYFAALDRHLAPGGRIGLQTITMAHDRMLATRHTYTWIQKYIFPGGLLPSVTAIGDSLARTTLRIIAREDFGAHYAQTLRIWRERFGAQAAEIARLGFDEVFNRMWTFYLCYSEAGFRAGYIDVSQLTLARV